LLIEKLFFDSKNFKPDPDFETEWNRDNIRESIQDWRKSLERREHLLWFSHNDDLEPLDMKNLKLKITFQHLAGREGFKEQRVKNVFCYVRIYRVCHRIRFNKAR